MLSESLSAARAGNPPALGRMLVLLSVMGLLLATAMPLWAQGPIAIAVELDSFDSSNGGGDNFDPFA